MKLSNICGIKKYKISLYLPSNGSGGEMAIHKYKYLKYIVKYSTSVTVRCYQGIYLFICSASQQCSEFMKLEPNPKEKMYG